ncbi:MAG: glycosyltransferase [Candidatus Cloacimonetes bacterium]|nr:glycosyltransferase [Candidatus Cloacimonadota bacterium]
MKVVRIIARLNVGGPAKHVVWLSDMFQKDGFDTLLLYGEVEENEDSLEAIPEEQIFQAKKIPSFSRSIHPFKDLVTIYRILNHLIQFGPSVIHTHTSKAGLCGRLAALIYRKFYNPSVLVVHTYHGHTFHGYFHPMIHRLFLGLERFLGRFCTDKIVTISERQQREVLDVYKVGKKAQHSIVPLGLDIGFVDCLSPALRITHGISQDTFVFGIVGRIAAVKNHFLFLDSVCHMIRNDPQNKSIFVVIGDGDKNLLEALKQKVSHSRLSPRVLFLGNQSRPEDIYGMLNCLVLTSKNEGTPLSILEAFAASVPVIATRVGGVPDLLGSNERGILVNEDAEEIAQAMQKIQSGGHKAMTEGAKDFVQQGYSLGALYDRMKKVYKI